MYAGFRCPGLDHIFIRLGFVPPTPPSLSGLPAHTYVGLGTHVAVPGQHYK